MNEGKPTFRMSTSFNMQEEIICEAGAKGTINLMEKTGEKEKHLIKSKNKMAYILIQKLQPRSSKVK